MWKFVIAIGRDRRAGRARDGIECACPNARYESTTSVERCLSLPLSSSSSVHHRFFCAPACTSSPASVTHNNTVMTLALRATASRGVIAQDPFVHGTSKAHSKSESTIESAYRSSRLRGFSIVSGVSREPRDALSTCSRPTARTVMSSEIMSL